MEAPSRALRPQTAWLRLQSQLRLLGMEAARRPQSLLMLLHFQQKVIPAGAAWRSAHRCASARSVGMQSASRLSSPRSCTRATWRRTCSRRWCTARCSSSTRRMCVGPWSSRCFWMALGMGLSTRASTAVSDRRQREGAEAEKSRVLIACRAREPVVGAHIKSLQEAKEKSNVFNLNIRVQFVHLSIKFSCWIKAYWAFALFWFILFQTYSLYFVRKQS